MRVPATPPDPVEAVPGIPFHWVAQRVGTATLASGDAVPMVRIVMWQGNVRMAVFLTGPDVVMFADQIRQMATEGLIVATEMPPDPSP